METIVKYELFQVCQPNLVTPEYVVWRSERVNGGIVLPFAVTEAFHVFFRLPSEAEIVKQEFAKENSFTVLLTGNSSSELSPKENVRA